MANPKPYLSPYEAQKQLVELTERMGYSRQEEGWTPVIVFVTDEQFASLRRQKIDLSAVVQDTLDNAGGDK
jgi:post-segregation antitoxin (ccd killing protein)